MRWQRRQPSEQWLSADDLPETEVVITSQGAAEFDRYVAFQANYTQRDDPLEMDVHLQPGSDGQVTVLRPPDTPVPATPLGTFSATDAGTLLDLLNTLGQGKVARAMLIARQTVESGYQATVSGYTPDIMRMRAAGRI
jgi:hypothetical protein